MYRYYEQLYRYYEPLYRYMLMCIDTVLYRMHVLVLAWSSIDTWGLVSIQRLMYRYIHMLYRYKWGYFKFLPRWSIVSIHGPHVSIHSSNIVIFLMSFVPGYLGLHHLMPYLCIYFWYHRPLLRLYSRLLKISPDKIRCLQLVLSCWSKGQKGCESLQAGNMPATILHPYILWKWPLLLIIWTTKICYNSLMNP